MKNSCPVILSSVLLSFFVSINGGVQGQSFGTCITTDPINGDNNPFYNSQTIYSLLCRNRQEVIGETQRRLAGTFPDPTCAIGDVDCWTKWVADVTAWGESFGIDFTKCTGAADWQCYVSASTPFLKNPKTTPSLKENNITTITKNFKTLCSLLNSGTQSEVKNLLDNTSARITFFAPADAAFVGVDAASLTPGQIKAILQTHILPNPKLTTDLPCGECQCTMEGGGLCRTRTRTVCTTAGNAFQVGGGNTGPGGVQEFPQIGRPLDATTAFDEGFNQGTTGDTIKPWGAGNDNIILGNNQGYFSVDAVACNGIIHAVNKIIMPGVGGNQQCGYGGKGGKGSKGGKGGGYYFGGKGSGYYGGVEEVIVVNGNGGGFVEFVEFGRYGGKGYGRYGGKGRKGYYRRQLDMEETFFDDEDEDKVGIEGNDEEDSSVVPPQDHNTGSSSSSSSSTSTFEERSQRRKRFLESLINPNGEIEPLE